MWTKHTRLIARPDNHPQDLLPALETGEITPGKEVFVGEGMRIIFLGKTSASQALVSVESD